MGGALRKSAKPPWSYFLWSERRCATRFSVRVAASRVPKAGRYPSPRRMTLASPASAILTPASLFGWGAPRARTVEAPLLPSAPLSWACLRHVLGTSWARTGGRQDRSRAPDGYRLADSRIRSSGIFDSSSLQSLRQSLRRRPSGSGGFGGGSGRRIGGPMSTQLTVEARSKRAATAAACDRCCSRGWPAWRDDSSCSRPWRYR